MKAKTLRAAVSASILVLASVAAEATGVLGSNLVVNGGAESGTGGNGNTIIAAPGFLSLGNFTVTSYSSAGGFPTLSDPGPSNRGLNLFTGGPDNSQSGAIQSIDVSSIFASIDGGAVSFELSAYLGGFASQQDNAVLTATFLGSSKEVLGSGSIGPVTDVDRGNATGLLLRQTTGAVPVGTRFIDLQLTMTRRVGTYNDGYADNLSLVLSAVPEGSSIAQLGLGLAVLGLWRRKRSAAT